MSQWKIVPADVQTILTAVTTDAGELRTALEESKFQAVLDGLLWGGMITQDVPTAVNAVFADQAANLTTINNRIDAGVVGVSNAVIAYNNGQEDMSATYQTELLSSAEDGDFSYFVDHGYQG